MPLPAADRLPEILRHTTVSLVRSDEADLSARQLAVFLTCYLTKEKQTVRGLATNLNVSKPAVTRTLDRLEFFDLVIREDDPSDRRSLFVGRTPKGEAFLRDLKQIMIKAAKP